MPLGKRLQYTTFDVFTQTPFKGNPLAIVTIPPGSTLTQTQKQTIAREFNYSETVFLRRSEHGPYPIGGIEIFTITEELPFAGHPVIGTLCSIAGDAPPDVKDDLMLSTKAGMIRAVYDDKLSAAIARVPHDVHVHKDCLQYSRVQGLQPNVEYDDLLDMWPSSSDGYLNFPVVSVVKGMTFILIGFPTNSGALQKMQTGRQLTYAKALNLDEDWLPSFVAPYFYEVLSEHNDSFRIRARMIEPKIGEDPATGSAACTLGTYIALQRGGARKTYNFDIEQGVEMGRNSSIGVKVILDSAGVTVSELWLSGSAVQVMEGTVLL